MKFLAAVFLTALLSFVTGIFLPWWSLAIIAFLVAVFIYQRPAKAFLSGFLALFLLWALLALWIDVKNQGLLSHKIASLLKLGGSSVLLIIVTAFIGALVAGFGALSASYLRRSDTGK